jgi:integrase
VAVEALLAEIRVSLGLKIDAPLELCRVGSTISSSPPPGEDPTCDLSSWVNLRVSRVRYLEQKSHEVSPQHLKGLEYVLGGFMDCGSGRRDATRAGVQAHRDVLLRDGLAVATVNQHLAIIAAFLRWAGSKEDLSGLRLKAPSCRRAATQRAAFTDAEVVRLLKATEWKARTPSQQWLPLLMAYTGARPEELAQLQCRDVQRVGTTLVLNLATIEDGQRRKNEASRRLVPVHSQLMDGIWDLGDRKNPTSLLFPELGDGGTNGRRAEAPSRWFNRKVLRDYCNIKDPRKVLYSFRHTVATKLKHLGVEESLIAELLGHTVSSQTMGRYGKAYPVEALKTAVEAITYEDLS